MATNLGKLHSEPFQTEDVYFYQSDEQIEAGEPKVLMSPGQTYWQAHMEDGTAWNAFCRTLKLGKKDWFIAVREDGWILSAEQDPTALALPDADIWRIEHDGPHRAIITHKWNGKEVVDWTED